MSLVSSLKALISAIKSTTSTKVEYSDVTASLPAIHAQIALMFAERGIAYCPAVSDLQALVATESQVAWLQNSGFYINSVSQNTSVINYQSTDGTYWNRNQTVTMNDLIDATGISTGEFIMWDGTKFVPNVATVASLGWANITGKPTITGTTNPAIAGAFSVTGTTTLGVLTATSAAVSGAVSGVSLASSMNTTVGQDLIVTRDTSVGRNLTVVGTNSIAGSNTVTGNETIGGTLGVTGIATFNSAIIVLGAAVMKAITAVGNMAVTGTITASGDITTTGNLGGNTGNFQTIYSLGAILSSGLTVTGNINFINSGLGNGGVKFPNWTSGTRPVSGLQPSQTGYNTTINKLETWDGSTWQPHW